MKKKSSYNKIGTLHLFKPDYLSENKKTFLTSNIIKEYLRKRKGRYFYKVNFLKNRFNFKQKEKKDIINNKLELKLIENSYNEMKSEIHKRFIDDKTFENDKYIKLFNSKYNCISSRNRSRNNIIFKNINNPIVSDYNTYQKKIKFRKTYSKDKYGVLNNYSNLNIKYMNAFIKNMNVTKKQKHKSIINKYLNEFQSNIGQSKLVNNLLQDSHLKEKANEINYYKYNKVRKEMTKSISNHNFKNKLSIFNDLKNTENNLFTSSLYIREANLKKKYNFFRIGEGDINNPTLKFLKVQKVLNFQNKKKPNGKFHRSFVQYFINNIIRKEKTQIQSRERENSKINKSLIFRKEYCNFNRNKFNDNEFKLKNFNSSFV